jgi:hypothetical protein
MAAAKTNWYNEAWSVDIDTAKQEISTDFLKIKKYVAKLLDIATIFRSLEGPLKSPQLSKYATRIDGIIGDVEEFSRLSHDCVSLMDDLDREWEALMSRVAKGEKNPQEALQEVPSLQGYRKYLTIAEKAGAIQDKVTSMLESSNYIDWTLEDYLGGGAGIYKELDKKNPGNIFEDIYGTLNLFGVLVLYTNEEILSNWIEGSKD